MLASSISQALWVVCATGTAGIIAAKVISYFLPWLKYDFRYLKTVARILFHIKRYGRQQPIYTMVDRLVDLSKTIPEKAFVYFEDDVWSYKRMNSYTNKVAKVLHNAGIKHKDSVAIFMTSSPEFIGIWFGIAKTGATSAFINYNIRGKSLMHCLKVSECKSIIVGDDEELLKAIREIEEEIEEVGITVYVMKPSDDEQRNFRYESFTQLLDQESPEEIPRNLRKDLDMGSHFIYVYTSGTTGLPKAALVRHDRAWLASQMIVFGGGRSDDIIYSPLPLYHAAAGMIGVLGGLYLGCSVIVRKKFSASQFWKDCRKYKATYIQYIGETMRYICDTPPSPDDKNHCVRAAMGNGLRPGVWKNFLDRFGQDIKIMEIYAATEGNAAFVNLDNHLGSIGIMSPLMKATKMIRLVKYDQEKEEIYKDERGRCVDVPDGTPGLLIAKITKSTAFHGYRGNKKQTESKILRNAFVDGDEYFNTGDLLRRDHDYHLYFVDRIGDTFRWKGENVSTNEVSDVISVAPGVKEANVYGVEIPGKEGRAGMVVLLLEDYQNFDSKAVYKHVSECLASYARPLFVRIKEELELTGTFKQKKVNLVKEGFDPKNMDGDPLYFMDGSKKDYVPLTQELHNKIINDKVRI